MLAAYSSGECEECDSVTYQQLSPAAASSFQAPVAPAEPRPEKLGRGKYVRKNGKGIRRGWKATAKKHMNAEHTASLFTQETCSVECSFNRQCLQSLHVEITARRSGDTSFPPFISLFLTPCLLFYPYIYWGLP
eukprot:1316099-Pleurochrysis_carterae.AAC.1